MARRWMSVFLILCLLLSAMPLAALATEGGGTDTPPVTDPPPATNPPATDPPATDPPATNPPATDPPATNPPATEPPATDPPPVTSGSCGDDMTWSFNVSTGAMTISGGGAMDDFDDQPWEHLRDQIRSITFGTEIRSISKYAFSGCSNLTTIRFLGHVPGTIGSNAFKGATATVYYPGLDPDWADVEKKNYGGTLTWQPELSGGIGGVFGNRFVWTLEGSTLTIVGKGNMGGWESGVENPPWYAYRNQITKVVMNGSIYCIYTSAFRDMPNLTTVEWPDDLNIIYSSAFYNCTGLTKLSIPNSVYLISDYAFYGCENLRSLTLPSKLKELGRNVFTNCKSLTSVNLSDKLETIGQKAFSYSGLTGIIIPAKVTKLRTGTFQGCRSLETFSAMGNVTEIGKECFASCTKLTGLELPASVKSIGEEAFSGSGLKELVFGGDMPTIGAGAFQDVKTSVFYPKGNTTWSETRLQVLQNTYSKSLSFYAGTPDSFSEPTEAPTEAPTQAPTEAPTEAPTQAPTEPEPTEVVVIATEPEVPDVTEPAEFPTEAPVQQLHEEEELSLLDYWPVAVAAIWFFGGSALTIWFFLIRPRRRR